MWHSAFPGPLNSHSRYLANLAGVAAEDFGGFGPELPLHRHHMALDVMRQVDVVVLPDVEDFSLSNAGEGVELFGKRSEAARDADFLSAFAGLGLQFTT